MFQWAHYYCPFQYNLHIPNHEILSYICRIRSTMLCYTYNTCGLKCIYHLDSRCHSYHTELSRPLYARRFVRVLTSWTMAKKERMYWQGMDSMCAPILLLYQNEALACKCCSSQVWCVSMSINECGGVVAWCYCVVCCFDTHLTMFFFVIHQVLYWKK